MKGLNNNSNKMDPRFKLMLIFAGLGVLFIGASILVGR